MPHIIVEYSDGLETEITTSCLLDSLLETAKKIEALPIGGLRLRAVKQELIRVGDGDFSNQFVYIIIRLGHGRSDEVKRDIGSRLFDVLKTVLQSHFDDMKPLSLGLEIQEIDPDWTWKKNNIHQILKEKYNGQI